MFRYLNGFASFVTYYRRAYTYLVYRVLSFDFEVKMFAPIDRLFVVCSLSRVKKIYIFKCSFKECQMFNKYWPFNSNFRESSNFCISFCSILFFLSVSLSQCISVMHKQMRKIYLLPTHHSRKRVYIIYHTLCLSNFDLSLPYTHTHPGV